MIGCLSVREAFARRGWLCTAAVFVTACGSSTGTTPSTVTTPTPPTVTLQQRCSPLGGSSAPTVCLASLETDLYYTYTTSLSSATPSYQMTFGDGQTCGPTVAACNGQATGLPNTRYWIPHTYAAGTFTAQLTVTDASGSATGTATVTVKSLSGTWVAGSGSDGCTGRRVLQLTQTGTALSGSYTNPFASTNAFTGTVNANRDVSIDVPGPGLVFTGMAIDGHGVNSDASAMLLQITSGDQSCGSPTLTFQRQ